MPLFSIPLSGLTASSTAMSTIANNLANLNTVGYKGSNTQFADLFYQRSISSVYSALQTADSSLSSAVTCLQRAITLGTEGANGTLSQQDRDTVAQEVKGISQQMLSVANLSFNGHYVFA